MSEPRWLLLDEVLWLHDLQIREFGGSAGVRDRGLLASAIVRVQQRFHYGELTQIDEIAVAYVSAINANHPFVDGNKRVAFHCLLMFLRLNGYVLEAEPERATKVMLAVAAGEMNESALRTWRERTFERCEGFTVLRVGLCGRCRGGRAFRAAR